MLPAAVDAFRATAATSEVVIRPSGTPQSQYSADRPYCAPRIGRSGGALFVVARVARRTIKLMPSDALAPAAVPVWPRHLFDDHPDPPPGLRGRKCAGNAQKIPVPLGSCRREFYGHQRQAGDLQAAQLLALYLRLSHVNQSKAPPHS